MLPHEFRCQHFVRTFPKAYETFAALSQCGASDEMREGSDIDFAIAGLPPEKFYGAVGEVAETIQYPFDMVDLDDESPFVDYLKIHGGLKRIG